ncbi:MAG: glycosyltransferase family 4 protein [Paracoccaceae bacterium]
MAITKNKPTARCLDLTRLISRVGRGPWTGVDRVELEYLAHLHAVDAPMFALVHFRHRYALIDREGVRVIQKYILGHTSWGKSNLLSLIFGKSFAIRKAAHFAVGRLAMAQSPEGGLKELLTRNLPPGTAYLNVGHSNLSQEVFEGIRSVPDAKLSVFVHDTIPLDFPQFQRPETISSFESKLRNVARYADLVICNSRQTGHDDERVMSAWGKVPKIAVAHLGVRTASAKPDDLPPDIDMSNPYFVVIGTIEPRKNHALLLDIWTRLSAEHGAPRLFVVGQRGWKNENVFRRLDRRPAMVTELSNLSDGAVSALLQRSSGLLIPSFCEGFGLPAIEAAALGIPVICNSLSVFCEILGEYPIYADVADIYSWETVIRKLAKNSGSVNRLTQGLGVKVAIPTWEDHFDQVLRIT